MLRTHDTVQAYEKHVLRRSMPDWHLALNKLRDDARANRLREFELRSSAVQLRNETRVATDWDTKLNEDRLRDRIFNVDLWRGRLESALEGVNCEIFALRQEKILAEKCAEALHMPLSVASECLVNRDNRRIVEITHDPLDDELKKELYTIESNRKRLEDACHDAWEKENQLNEIKRRLEKELSNKREAIEIDEAQLNLNKNSSGLSYQIEPFRTLQNSITEDCWLDLTKDTVRIADGVVAESKKMREKLFQSRERSKNELNTQKNIVEHSLRKRIFDTQRSRNELQWQQKKMKDSMMKAALEIRNSENDLVAKINPGKLVETRSENRTYRPGLELATDRVSQGLEEEAKRVRKTMAMLHDKINQLKSSFNAMEDALLDIERDLDDKENTLEVDSRCLEIRAPLIYPERSQTVRNIALANINDEIARI